MTRGQCLSRQKGRALSYKFTLQFIQCTVELIVLPWNERLHLRVDVVEAFLIGLREYFGCLNELGGIALARACMDDCCINNCDLQ